MNGQKLNLKQIAELAGVSLTTASMYLNGKAKRYSISDSTCERIETVIREHHYIPNFHARAIASKKTYLIGVLINGPLDTSFWLNILSGLEQELAKRQYNILLSVSREDPARELEQIEFLRAKGVDGLIVNPVLENCEALRELSKDFPCMTLNRPLEGVSGVWNDNRRGAETLMNLLLKKGHRRIAYVGERGGRRTAAYEESMRKHHLRPAYFDNVETFLPNRNAFTAAFCFSDFILYELYQKAWEMHFSIPDDLSLTGYDGMFFMEPLHPLPTTVSQYKNELGTEAGKMILELIDAPKGTVKEKIFLPRLIPGQSVKDIPC